jgi:hypothetical protein
VDRGIGIRYLKTKGKTNELRPHPIYALSSAGGHPSASLGTGSYPNEVHIWRGKHKADELKSLFAIFPRNEYGIEKNGEMFFPSVCK